MASVALLRCCCLLVLLFLLVEGQYMPGLRISERKCRDYKAKTQIRTRIIPLTLYPSVIETTRFNCSKTVDLIVGGEAAKPGEFPHQALLGYPDKDTPGRYQFDCGGSLISERFVLTAAHCFARRYPSIVRLGENDLSSRSDYEKDIDIEEFVKHPQYKFREAYNDIALLKLKQDVQFTKEIRPACLWTGSEFNFSSVIATGFGMTEYAGDKANVLQKVKLDLLEGSSCDETFASAPKFPRGVLSSQLCIGIDEGGKDTCQGDSGGPVQTITDTKGCTYHIVGVTSTSLSGCGIGKTPAIYTRVYSYLDWIEKTVWG